MTTDRPDALGRRESPPPATPLVLDYHLPERGAPVALQWVRRTFAVLAGLTFALSIEFACLLYWGLANLRLGPDSDEYDLPVVWRGPTLCSTVGFVILCWMVWMSLRTRSHFFVAGLLLGAVGGLLYLLAVGARIAFG